MLDQNNIRKITMSLLASLFGLLGCRDKKPTLDFTTPEGAILKLEDAYRKKDIEAAIAAKDFPTEARLNLAAVYKEYENDDELLKKTAEVLELTFRAEIRDKGFPDFNGVTSQFPKKVKHRDFEDVMVVTEVCTYKNGSVSAENVNVVKTTKGWRVLHTLKMKASPAK